MIGVFGSLDVFLFYVFFEAMLIPMYFLIGGLRRPAPLLRRGEVPALLASPAACSCWPRSSALYVVAGKHGTFDYRALLSGDLHLSHNEQIALFLGFFIAFAIKAPLWPFHTWLPDAAAEAPDRCRRDARRRPRQGRHVRLPALLHPAVPVRARAPSRRGSSRCA